MKHILIVSTVPTHPVNAGNRMWIKENSKLLESLGHDVHFLYVYVQSWRNKDVESINETQKYWGSRFHLYKVSLIERLFMTFRKRFHSFFNNNYICCDDKYPIFLHKKIKKLENLYDFDTCIVQYYYLTKLFEYLKSPLKVLATHDNFTYKDLVVNQSVSDCLDANQSAKAMQRSQIILSLNSQEHIFFEMLSPKSRVYTVYGYYDYHPQPVADNRNILFLSGASMFNMNGLKWFINDIFPSIIDRFPDCKLIIGGSICKNLQCLKNNRNIIIQGDVSDVDNFYRQGDICINPTFQGTGLKTKTFEAVSYDKVEIAHPHSSIGIYAKEMAPVLFSSKAEEWVKEIELLWSNKEHIISRKKKNEEYIKSLQLYVVRQYKDFLK